MVQTYWFERIIEYRPKLLACVYFIQSRERSTLNGNWCTLFSRLYLLQEIVMNNLKRMILYSSYLRYLTLQIRRRGCYKSMTFTQITD